LLALEPVGLAACCFLLPGLQATGRSTTDKTSPGATLVHFLGDAGAAVGWLTFQGGSVEAAMPGMYD